MRRFILPLLLCGALLQGDEVAEKYVKYLQHLPAKTKKYRFFKLLLPPVRKIDKELRTLYLQTLHDIQNNTHKKRLAGLMKKYRAVDYLDLLKRIKPHPISITLAQAAIESAWGTSRFFVEANNVFGVWSRSSDPADTIEASKSRTRGRKVHLRRYINIEASVRDYYKNLAINNAYKCFRQARYYNDNPFELAPLLHKYSEKGELYTVYLVKIILKNNLTRYDVKTPLPRYVDYGLSLDNNSTQAFDEF